MMNGDSPPPPPSPPPPSAAAAERADRGRGGAVINRARRELWEPDADHFPSLADRARASTRHVIKNGLASPTHSAHATFFRPQPNSTVNNVSADRRAKKVTESACRRRAQWLKYKFGAQEL